MAVLVFCLTFSMLAGFTMLRSQRFKKHPFRLFACQLLVYACMCQ